MPRVLTIPPTRFQGALPANVGGVDPGENLLTWTSITHDLKQTYPGRLPGSDRATDVTVNAYLRLTFNAPLGNAALRILAAPVVTMSGVAGPPAPGAVSVNVLGYAGTTTIIVGGSTLTFNGPPLPQYGSSFQVISFPVAQTIANLGQSVSYRVAFARYDGFPDPLLLDATFAGSFVSSDPL